MSITPPTAAYIGLGSNLGDASRTVLEAIAELNAVPATSVMARSSLFRTAPVDAAGPDFVNAVAKIETRLEAHDLLNALQAIEERYGRKRPYRNAPRTLDLDLLLFGDHRIQDQRLTVPHPRAAKRAFVLIPLLQIDPFLSIPGIGPAHACISGVAGQHIERIPDPATVSASGASH